MSNLIDPSKMMMLPLSEFERLKDQIRELTRIIESHLYRDASVSEILSGSRCVWLCEQEISDLREQVRELSIAEEANYELSKEVSDLEARIAVFEVPVDPDEQLKTVIEWIRSGGT